MGKHLIESMPVWVTTLGRGPARASVTRRAKARAEKAEVNRKFRDIGETRRIGRLVRLLRYGDDILAEFEVLGAPRPIRAGKAEADEMLRWMREFANGQ